MIDQTIFREAMSHVGSAVSIITTDGKAGRAGMTVSAVCSVTDSPPTLLVCINRSSRSHDIFLRNGVLCVNILNAAHQELSGLFASKADQETRFLQAVWHRRVTGAPALEDAIVSFDCRIESITDIGTHSVIFSAIQDIEIRHGSPALVYFRRGYHALGTS
ncbi:flavin reductase [Acetobacter persici]|uniref:flavin reductase n=1 Tax=Acetobacter persici TaxID=1076596 RepID=UPI0020CFDA25|nr:flavin reductase [Acetobacter persici]MCP9318201.1 flavin reductase [Acetobacter persici]